ncbi:MAG TPA: type II secretion system F family protein [Streptosporangiaceae bacterium]
MSRVWAGPAPALAGAAAVLAGLAALFALGAGTVSAASGPEATSQRTALILLDINGSIGARGMAEERQTAAAYAGALPADVRVGLITFAGKWRLALSPTADRARLAAAVGATRLAGGRSVGLYGAISRAHAVLKGLGAVGQSRLLVLSDGEDIRAQPVTPDVPIDVITWHFDRDDFAGPLLALAAASGGHATEPAHVTALAAAFASIPKTPAPASATPSATRSAQAGASQPESAQGWPSRQLMAVLAVVFVALFVLVVLMIGGLRGSDRGRHLVREFESYGPRHAPTRAASSSEPPARRSLADAVSGVLRSLNREERLAERLELAGIGRNPAEWVMLGALACLVLSVVLSVLIGSALFGILVGTMLGWLGMVLTVSYRIRRRRGMFSDQLPDVLQLLAGSLQAGFSLAQALDAVVREDHQPSAGEFSRALAETRLGVDLADALDTVANRMASKDLSWTVMAVRIQREVGGNLAEVLRNTVETMRERAYLHRHVRALSAEGRLSAYILIGLPVLVGAWLFYTSPDYMRPLYTTAIGIAMLVVAVVFLIVGSWWMSKVVKVEV